MTDSLAFTAIQGQMADNATDQSDGSTTTAADERDSGSTHSLAALWARKYMLSVTTRDNLATQVKQSQIDPASQAGRSQTVEQLLRNLTLASAQAWSKTETLLSKEVQRHGIDSALINPWQIAKDSHTQFHACLEAYGNGEAPMRLTVIVGPSIGHMRQKYTFNDPRTLGFVSMQFHYTGTLLLEQLSATERSLFAPYLKVMDDHLYMPLRDAYEAAANHPIDSPILGAVQQLLPVSTQIAQAVCEQVGRLRPDYQSYSGLLNADLVRTSSIRDVEMFQVYLCLCALEESIRSVQQELFPLCVMLYPRLGVKWELVQEMLQAMGWEMLKHLSPNHMGIFLPYLKALTEMFSIEAFTER